jgi:hypothetical protein
MVEQTEGEVAQPAVGKEIDRLAGLVKTAHDISQQRESLSINVETNKSGGILSALFGPKASKDDTGTYSAEQTDVILGQVMPPPQS